MNWYGSSHRQEIHAQARNPTASTYLDVAHDFPLGSGDQRVASLGQDLHEVVGEVATGQVGAHDRVRQRVALVHGHRVRHAIPRVQDQA